MHNILIYIYIYVYQHFRVLYVVWLRHRELISDGIAFLGLNPVNTCVYYTVHIVLCKILYAVHWHT